MTTISSALGHQEYGKQENFSFASILLLFLPRQVSRKLAVDKWQQAKSFLFLFFCILRNMKGVTSIYFFIRFEQTYCVNSLPKGSVRCKVFCRFRKCLHWVVKEKYAKCYETQGHQLWLRMSWSANHWKLHDYVSRIQLHIATFLYLLLCIHYWPQLETVLGWRDLLSDLVETCLFSYAFLMFLTEDGHTEDSNVP